MRILYINHYAGSLKHGMEFRPYYLAREWVKQGHSVRIIGGDFSHLRTKNPTIKKDFEKENIDGIEYQWVKAGSYQGNGIKRALTMFRFVWKLRRKAKKLAKEFRPDVVIASSTYPLDTYAAQKIAKIAKCKYVHESHDLWPLTLIELGGMSNKNPFIKILAVAEKSAYKNACKVVSVLPDAYKHMLMRGLDDKDKFVYIPNGIAVEDWENRESIPEEHQNLLKKLKEEGKFIVCYLGGHAVSNYLDVFIDAAKSCAAEDIAFILVGKGVEKEKLEKRVIEEKINSVYFLPPVNKKAVPTMLAQADSLYIGAKPCKLYEYGVSMNKLYDYMMSGTPVVYSVEASNNEVKEAGCGITVQPQPENILLAIRQLQAMSMQERQQMGATGKKWVLENREYSILAKKFIATIKADETIRE